MLKDIPNLKVTSIGIAICPRHEEDEFWDVFLINQKNEAIRNLIVSSKGYGEQNDEMVKTVILRQYVESVQPNHFFLIEALSKNLFNIANEYWISFQLNGHLYDKRFVFVNGSINNDYFIQIPFLDRKGVMIM